MPKPPKAPAVRKEILLERERHDLHDRFGGGVLSYEVWGYVDKGDTVITRYSLAYINHLMHQRDNGRVLGYDNAHGFHHRHYIGMVESVTFTSYDDTLEQFQQEWQVLVNAARRKKS